MSIHIYKKMQLNMGYLLKCLCYIPCTFGMHLVYLLKNGCYYLFTMHCIILNNTSNILEDRSRMCRITLELLRNSRLDTSSWWVWVDMRLYELCYGNLLVRYVEREWYDCCSSRQSVSGPIIPTVRLHCNALRKCIAL